LLFVTVVGGLAANIGLVLIVGLGLTAARFLFSTFADGIQYVALALTTATTSLIVMFIQRETKRRTGKLGALLFIFFGLVWAVLIAALIGLAAGIK